MENKDFIVECSVCRQRYENHIGSTQCCGALAYVVENGEVTKGAVIYVKTVKEIKPTIINIGK